MLRAIAWVVLCLISLSAGVVKAQQQTCVQLYTFVNAGYVQGGVVYATGYWRTSGTFCQGLTHDDGLGDIGFAPPSNSQVKFKLLQADENLTCQSSQLERDMAAERAARDVPLFARAGLFLVTFAPGNRQFYACNSTFLTNCGITQLGACGSNPAVPDGY